MDPQRQAAHPSGRISARSASTGPAPARLRVVNRKGGANKTPTVASARAILARYSGAATVAWDNNESQGTLGWRTEKGSHYRSVLDLIDASAELLSPSTNAA